MSVSEPESLHRASAKGYRFNSARDLQQWAPYLPPKTGFMWMTRSSVVIRNVETTRKPRARTNIACPPLLNEKRRAWPW